MNKNMKVKIRKLTEKEYPEYIRITSEAYPGIGIVTLDDRSRSAVMAKLTCEITLDMADS